MTSWVTLLLRHFIRVRDNAWNPRVFVETGGRGKRLKPTGGENLYRQIHAASTRRAKSTRLAWKSRQIGGPVLLISNPTICNVNKYLHCQIILMVNRNFVISCFCPVSIYPPSGCSIMLSLGKQNFRTCLFGTSGSNTLFTIPHFLHVNTKYIGSACKYQKYR